MKFVFQLVLFTLILNRASEPRVRIRKQTKEQIKEEIKFFPPPSMTAVHIEAELRTQSTPPSLT